MSYIVIIVFFIYYNFIAIIFKKLMYNKQNIITPISYFNLNSYIF